MANYTQYEYDSSSKMGKSSRVANPYMVITPKGITDFHTGKIPGEQDHVHFKNGSALNKDGTWKHGHGKLTNEQKQYLKQNGWNIE